MKRYRGWLILLLILTLCGGGIYHTLRATAEYPPLGEPVSYPVNQVEGFELKINEPSWSPFRGYTINWKVEADSDKAYTFTDGGPGFEYLERFADGQWHRLGYTQDNFSFNSLELALGGEEGTSLEGGLVQKYSHYGTRLEVGTYRLVLEMTAGDGALHYLAAEFEAG